MNSLTLLEFQRISGLSDRALLWLLANNKLPITVRNGREIVIDSQGVDVEDIVQSMRSQTRDQFASHRPLIEERIGALLADKLDELKDDIVRRLRGPS